MTELTTNPKIVVTRHAYERLVERSWAIDNGVPLDREDAERFIRREIEEALDAGRTSRQRPRWMDGGARPRLPRRDRRSFVWTETRARVYGVVIERDELVVATTLPGVAPQPAVPKVKPRPPFGQDDLDRWFGGTVEQARKYMASRTRTAGWQERRRKRLLKKAGRRAARKRRS